MNHEMATIRIKNLRLRTLIGINPDEVTKKQDVVLNIEIGYPAYQASIEDDIKDALNYRTLTKRIISFVEDNQFSLLERMANDVLNLIRDTPHVHFASVEVDKPHALRFADSVSIQLTFG